MNSGDTFLIKEPGTSLDSHLWMVISDTILEPNHVLIVNLTSFRTGKDGACIVNPGEHPFVRKPSCVHYKGAKWVSVVGLAAMVADGKIEPQQPLSKELLSRIRLCSSDSLDMEIGMYRILDEQGLVGDW